MSRITDYVLEPNIVYTNGSFLIKVKVQDSYKYKKYLVSENIKYKTISGTTFTLTDVKQGQPGSILQLEGNTTQNGTPTPTNPSPIYTVSGDNEVVVCGKNKFNYNGEILENYINGSGMTYSVSNGEYTLNGSNTRIYIYIRYDTVLPAGTYFFSGCPSGGSTNGYSGLLQANGTNYFDFGSGVSFTLNAETTVKVYPIRVGGSRITVDNLKFKTQIEKGNTKTSFEPYTGNSYRVDLGGKNKLDLSAFTTTTSNGITVTPITNNGVLEYLESSGTYSQQTYITLTNTLHLEPNTQYILSGAYSASARLRLREYNSGGSNLSEYFDSGSGVSFTTKSNVSYVNVQIVFYAQNNVKFYPQIELGTVATRYSPYVSNPIELCKIGNYVDKLKRAEGKQLFNYTSQTDDGWYSDIPNFINDTGTYTISINNKSLTGNWAVYFINSSKQRVGDWIKASSSVSTPSTFTVTTEQANAPYIRILPNASGLHDIENYNIMVNEGSTALPYEPNGVNKWYIENNIKKVILNGSETGWTSNSPSTGIRRFYKVFSDIYTYNDQNRHTDKYLNDHFTINTSGSIGTCFHYQNQLFFYMNGNDYTSVDSWKTWLSNNNTTIYYVLKNPTYEIITNETLIEQLNNIQDLELQPDLCYIDWIGSESPTMLLQYGSTEILNANIITEDGKKIRTDWGI